MWDLLRTYSWQELRQHPWRNATAAGAVMLGVALALAVHLINASALAEFSAATRSVQGQPDLQLRSVGGALDEDVFARVAADARVDIAGPVLELAAQATAADGRPVPLRVLGVDVLVAATLAPELFPQLADGSDRFALFGPGRLFLNAAARQKLGPGRIAVQSGLRLLEVSVAGSVPAGGAPLAVMDIAAAQDLFGRAGQLSRIDVRLRPGTDGAEWIRDMALPQGVSVTEPEMATRSLANLSRAYRVNLTVLALVALFTGAFLVFSVLSLSVARRTQQLALLGVLGLQANARMRLVLAESAMLGLAGSVLGVALGTALAALALRVLGGDLGGGYFEGVAPRLQWSPAAAVVHGALGVAAAVVGGWLPARQAQRLPLALALKGLRAGQQARHRAWLGPALLAGGAALALLPPVAGLPLGAYAAVALLLLGGIAILPPAVRAVYDRLAPRVAQRPLALLAVERARRLPETAAVAVSGVVAALSLSVALTVMVASFRASVTAWLDVVLPADLYVRTAGSSAAADTAYLDERLVEAAGKLPGVARLTTQQVRSLVLDPARPAIALLARPLAEPARELPLTAEPVAVPGGQVAVYVSEAVADLHGARPGDPLPRLDAALGLQGAASRFTVAGTWRDYARQNGAIVLDQRDYRRLTGDTRVSELQLWLAPGADPAAVQQGLRAEAGTAAALLEMASTQDLRATSLRIFDRSFAVTYWLQAVAIAIGLFGVAASFGAQVLARRKEFGLLGHLGLTRRQILAVVAGEGAAWTGVGAAAGLVLGLGVALVLVHVVNPQSFHWTMDMLVPWGRLLLLCAGVVAAGTLTAWAAGRAAAGRDAVLAVKEDW